MYRKYGNICRGPMTSWKDLPHHQAVALLPSRHPACGAGGRGALMGDVAALYRKVAASRQVCIAYELRPTSSIYGFPGQLTQVFGNMLRNATEAAPPKSQVVVRVRPTRAPRTLRHPYHHSRSRSRHSSQRAGTDVRPLLHHQGTEGLRPGTVGVAHAGAQT